MIIGFGNRARHGKDTAAEAIMAHATKMLRPTLKMSWAHALREETNAFMASPYGQRFIEGVKGLNIERDIMLPDWVTPTPDAEPVEGMPFGKHSKLLQWWGTDYRRNFGQNYWVNQGEAKIDVFLKKHPNGVVLVPDCRFENEVGSIENRYKGVTIQCTRLNADGTPFRDPGRDPNHVSETTLDNYNWQHKIISKSAALTGEFAITIFEFERGLRGL